MLLSYFWWVIEPGVARNYCICSHRRKLTLNNWPFVVCSGYVCCIFILGAIVFVTFGLWEAERFWLLSLLFFRFLCWSGMTLDLCYPLYGLVLSSRVVCMRVDYIIACVPLLGMHLILWLVIDVDRGYAGTNTTVVCFVRRPVHVGRPN